MKRTGDDLRSLVGLLDGDIAHLEAIVQDNTRAEERIRHGADDALDYAALGYTIHNLYSFIENYLLRIVKQFENSLTCFGMSTAVVSKPKGPLKSSGWYLRRQARFDAPTRVSATSCLPSLKGLIDLARARHAAAGMGYLKTLS